MNQLHPLMPVDADFIELDLLNIPFVQFVLSAERAMKSVAHLLQIAGKSNDWKRAQPYNIDTKADIAGQVCDINQEILILTAYDMASNVLKTSETTVQLVDARFEGALKDFPTLPHLKLVPAFNPNCGGNDSDAFIHTFQSTAAIIANALYAALSNDNKGAAMAKQEEVCELQYDALLEMAAANARLLYCAAAEMAVCLAHMGVFDANGELIETELAPVAASASLAESLPN
jgi:hypothetical protein